MRFWREYMKFPVIAVAFAGLVGYCLLVVNERANSQQTLLGPVGYAIGPGYATAVQSTSAVQVIGPNPTRRFIEICNPTTATTVWIAPIPLTATTQQSLNATAFQGAGSYPIFPFIAQASGTVNATVNCYRTPFAPIAPGSGGLVGAGWSAIAQVNGSSPVLGALTIFEY